MKKTTLITLLLIMYFNLIGQPDTSFSVEVHSSVKLSPAIIHFDLNEIRHIQDYHFLNWKVLDDRGSLIKSQKVNGENLKLLWIDNNGFDIGETKKYTIQVFPNTTIPNDVVSVKDNGNAFVYATGERELLRYRYREMPVPDGVDPIYSRGGFLHPVSTLKGNVLTQIQPSDHYHHYGIWKPWTHMEYDGKIYDLWNLIKGEGTVRHAGVLSKTEGEVFSELEVLHEHIIDPGRSERNVLNEKLKYKIWNPQKDKDYYILDVISQFSCNTELPVVIKAYRYQGFSIRGPKHWHDDNVVLLTSEGYDKSDGNATRAKWVQVSGPGSQQGESAFVFISNPTNMTYPEEIRVWPTGSNGGKESVFVNFNPAQTKDWIIYPNQIYTLKYRVVVSDKVFNQAEMQNLHDNFAFQLRASLIDNE